MKNIAVSLLYMARGSASGRWISRGKEYATDGQEGAIRFNPADGENHVLLGRAGSRGVRFSTLFIPQEAFDSVAEADGLRRLPDPRMVVWSHDPALQACMRVLTSPCGDSDDPDEAARSLVLRVSELMGGAPPEWTADESGFSCRTLGHLVAYIDAHLRIAPTAADMALLCGLSPSHFARRFRQSTGLSLHRFVNQRRIGASLPLLQQQSVPLSHVALDLGFSSQSHFTRLFSSVTGMSPARYRRQFRPTTA